MFDLDAVQLGVISITEILDWHHYFCVYSIKFSVVSFLGWCNSDLVLCKLCFLCRPCTCRVNCVCRDCLWLEPSLLSGIPFGLYVSSAMKCSREYKNHIASSYIMVRISKFHKPFLSEKIYCLEAERVTSNILRYVPFHI